MFVSVALFRSPSLKSVDFLRQIYFVNITAALVNTYTTARWKRTRDPTSPLDSSWLPDPAGSSDFLLSLPRSCTLPYVSSMICRWVKDVSGLARIADSVFALFAQPEWNTKTASRIGTWSNWTTPAHTQCGPQRTHIYKCFKDRIAGQM